MRFVVFETILCVLINFVTSDLNEVKEHLGTRTPYRYRQNINDLKLEYPECKDKKIIAIIRHGSRFPNIEDIQKINSVLMTLKDTIIRQHKLGRGQLKENEVSKFDLWYSNLDPEQENNLTLEGQDEMVLMAERMKRRFPNAINPIYDNKTFLFRHTATERAQQSARFFAVGLFNRKEAQKVMLAPESKVDPVLRFYKHCDKWRKKVKKNPEAFKEQKKFEISQVMNVTLKKITEHLGLSDTLTFDVVQLMYKACGYETAWHKYTETPWCYAFDKNTIQVLQYHNDLKYYWVDGYGHELNYKQACVTMKYFFNMLSDETSPDSTFLFTHSGTLLKVLSYLELYNSDPTLKADNMQTDRVWDTSNIDCFATNLAFILFRCKDGDKVLTLHQERIVKLPMCEQKLCPLETLVSYFKESINNCDLNEMCKLT